MHRARVALLLAAVLVTAACGGSDPGPAPAPSATPSNTLAPGLDTYTDRGDGCPQTVSAIGYADQVLRPAGQEDLQTFDDSARSRLAAVGGTIALELDDFPSPAVLEQAKTVQPLAEQSGALIDESDAAAVDERLAVFRRYRAEADRLVKACRDAEPTPTGAGSSSSPIKKLPSNPATERPTNP